MAQILSFPAQRAVDVAFREVLKTDKRADPVGYEQAVGRFAWRCQLEARRG